MKTFKLSPTFGNVDEYFSLQVNHFNVAKRRRIKQETCIYDVQKSTNSASWAETK